MMAPRVSVIVPAYNLARYLPAAIESALAQDLPQSEIEMIVVDDGSTDETPEVLARFADRIQVIRQGNRGLVEAVDRGLGAAGGEYIALLDADDEWPRDRLSRHLSILEANPAIGLVYGDMEVIGPAGETLHPSFFGWRQEQPSAGRVLGRLMAGNFISGGASTFRAALLPALHPIAPDAAYPDWWIAACIAAVAEISYDPGIANRYRYHGANMGLGAGNARQLQIQRLELPWRRWMMSHLVEDDTVSAHQLREVLAAWRFALLAAATLEGDGAAALLDIDPTAAAAVRREGADAGGRSGPRLMRALSRDPFDGALSIDLEVALIRECDQTAPEPAPPLAAVGLGIDPTLAWIDELLAAPELLRAFAAHAERHGPATLVVLAGSGADIGAFVSLVGDDPVTSGERCDIVVISEPSTTPARALLVHRASARLTLQCPREPYAALPLHVAIQGSRPAAAAA